MDIPTICHLLFAIYIFIDVQEIEFDLLYVHDEMENNLYIISRVII